MVSKDQTIGWLIFLVCVVVAVGYAVFLFYPEPLLGLLGAKASVVRFWLVAIPVLVAFVAVLVIGAWIGWTMATTPPPRPIEEFEAEEKPEPTEEAEAEEKKEA